MSRYIDADLLSERIKIANCEQCDNKDFPFRCSVCGTNLTLIHLKEAQTADVKPIVRGEWISKDMSDFVYCSNCDYKEWYSNVNNYCPNCGAIMRNVHSYHMKRWVY